MRRLATLAVLGTVVATSAVGAQQSRIGNKPPKLVLLVSIDQCRGDFVERFAPYYLPARSGGKLGGFRFLSETGAWFRDAHHNHVPTATGPGHATLMTGSEPAVNGIIGNMWFDRARNRGHYVVDDPQVQTVGGQSGPMSPRPLLVTTVGDELKMATNGRSKVVGIAMKDRASILMAGHSADTVIWYEGNSGNWVTSSWYARDKKLPTWVDELNRSRLVDRAYGTAWEPLLPADAYAVSRKAPGEPVTGSATKAFSHPLGAGGSPDRAYWNNLIGSHYGNEFVFATVERALDAERLGQRDVPDVLVMNLSTNDYVGHRFGPNSPEVQDISIRTDRLLSGLFNTLNRKIGIDNVAIVVTGDHGVLPVPEEMTGVYRLPAGRVTANLARPVQEALTASFGEGQWVLGMGLYEQNFYLNRETAAAKKVAMSDVERVAADTLMKQPGIYTAFTRTQILNNQLPQWDWIKRAVNGFHPVLGGDVMAFEAPGFYFGGGTGTGHGSAWDYDSHVPILMRGPGINRGKFSNRVHTADIASTLCQLLGIEYPTGNVGRPLVDALKK